MQGQRGGSAACGDAECPVRRCCCALAVGRGPRSHRRTDVTPTVYIYIYIYIYIYRIPIYIRYVNVLDEWGQHSPSGLGRGKKKM